MHFYITSDSMRTTLDIDKPILNELKRLGKRQKKTVGKLVSELLATSLKDLEKMQNIQSKAAFNWNSKSMGAQVDIEDKEALHAAMDKGP